MELLEKFGWYNPLQKECHPNSFVRDHLYTVNEGWHNNIPPYLLAHPANCQLLSYKENISKGSKSTITFEELLLLIVQWEKKHGKYTPDKLYVNKNTLSKSAT